MNRLLRSPCPLVTPRALVLILSVLASLSACSDETQVGPSGGSCPEGQVLVGGRCESARTRDVSNPDAADAGDATDEDTAGDAGDTADAVDSSPGDVPTEPVEPECTPDERSCFDELTVAYCTEEGVFAFEPCDGEVCVEGQCEPPSTICEPGERPGCADETHVLECDETGQTFEAVACPAETPNCLETLGECSDQVCVPDELRCGEGERAVERCEVDGSAWVDAPDCPLGTLCDRGECLSPCGLNEKLPSFLGCDYWAVDLDNLEQRCDLFDGCDEPEVCDEGTNICEPSAAGQQFSISVSNPHADPVELTITNGASSAESTYTVAPGEVLAIPLDRLDVNGSGRSRNAYRITSDLPVTAHQFNPANNVGVYSNDASLLLPTNVAGRRYVVMTWPTGPYGTQGYAIGSTENQGAFGYATIVAVANTEDPTEVTITPSVDVSAGAGLSALGAGADHVVELAYGEVLNLQTANEEGLDLSGTVIEASQPVLVYGGHECAFVPDDPLELYCDHIEQQLFPVDAWGSRYFAAKFSPRGNEDDVWRVVAADDGTILQTDPPIGGVNGVSLDSGEVLEFLTDQSFELRGSGPLLLAHFMVGSAYEGIETTCPANFGECDGAGDCEAGLECDEDSGYCVLPCERQSDCRRVGLGPDSLCSELGVCAIGGVGDPAFTLAVPVNQYRDNYVFLTPAGFRDDFVSVVAPSDATFTFDDAALVPSDAEPIGSTGYSIFYHSTAASGEAAVSHTIEGSTPFGVEAHGYDCDVSYAYPGGLNLNTE